MKTLTLTSILTVFLLTACDSGSSASAPAASTTAEPVTLAAAPANFTGTFIGTERGTFNSAPYSNTITLVLTKSGNDLVGTWTTGTGNTGTIVGSISGNNATAVITETDSCSGTIPTILTATSNGMTGTAVGTLTCGGINTTFDLVLQ